MQLARDIGKAVAYIFTASVIFYVIIVGLALLIGFALDSLHVLEHLRVA